MLSLESIYVEMMYIEQRQVNYLNEVVLGVKLNEQDWRVKVCSEEKYRTENISDQKRGFDLTNLNQLGINDLVKMREVYHKSLILGYLKINSLRNKIVNLSDVVTKVPIDILCIDEAKLDDSFPDSEFLIENYQFLSFRRNRNSKGGVKIIYVRQGLISKRLKNFELKNITTIWMEHTISGKKWCIVTGHLNINLLDPISDT